MISLEFHDKESFDGPGINYALEVDLEISNDEFKFKLEIDGSYANRDMTVKQLKDQIATDLSVYLEEL